MAGPTKVHYDHGVFRESVDYCFEIFSLRRVRMR
jgi:hypothetical protein